jgi:hypothetical protein
MGSDEKSNSKIWQMKKDRLIFPTLANEKDHLIFKKILILH